MSSARFHWFAIDTSFHETLDQFLVFFCSCTRRIIKMCILRVSTSSKQWKCQFFFVVYEVIVYPTLDVAHEILYLFYLLVTQKKKLKNHLFLYPLQCLLKTLLTCHGLLALLAVVTTLETWEVCVQHAGWRFPGLTALYSLSCVTKLWVLGRQRQSHCVHHVSLST